jgi:hypothetical protein
VEDMCGTSVRIPHSFAWVEQITVNLSTSVYIEMNEVITRLGARIEVTSQQLLHGDRQIAHALAGRVIDRVGNRGRHRHRGQLAKALGAQRARLLVEAADELISAFVGTRYPE